MKASSQSLQDHSGAVVTMYGLAIVQILWVAAWSFITLAVFYKLNPNQVQTDAKTDFLYFILLVSLYWTAEVVKNVGHVTTAGTVASWWFMPHSPSPTASAFKRAVTTSFGSICLGSLIVAVLKAIRQIIRNAQQNAARSDNIAACVILAC